MTSVIFVSLLLVAFEGAILLMLPHISPRRFLFAITVPQEFPSSEPGRNALRRYHWAVAAAIVLGAAAVLAFESRPQWTVCAVAIPCIGSLAAFLRERSHVRRIAGPVPDVREADLSGGDDRLPGWFALALPPFALPAAAALYLRSHWEDIPARFPIHWGIDGPDRWAEKSTHGVYGTLLSGAAMMLAFLLLTLVSFYGARRAPQRGRIGISVAPRVQDIDERTQPRHGMTDAREQAGRPTHQGVHRHRHRHRARKAHTPSPMIAPF